jgi:acyl-CoA synthetase (NDP forming)
MVGAGTDKAAVREILDKVRAEGRAALTAPEGKRICDAYGIPTPREGVATTADEAVALAEQIGFPVALKIVSPDILHKTDAGGVLVGVPDGESGTAGSWPTPGRTTPRPRSSACRCSSSSPAARR